MLLKAEIHTCVHGTTHAPYIQINNPQCDLNEQKLQNDVTVRAIFHTLARTNQKLRIKIHTCSIRCSDCIWELKTLIQQLVI